MDLQFMKSGEKFETLSTFNQNFSFFNNKFYTSVEPFDKIFQYEEFEELFKIEDKQTPFSKTLINSKESESKEMNIIKGEKEDKNEIDKKYVESIQIKVRENILSKRPFKEKKKIGRKKKEFEGLGQHNKFSDDNIINKIKHAILQKARIFINQKIKTLCVNEDGKILQKNVLFKLKQNQLESSKSAYDKKFLRKTLGEIFSQEISSKYILHPSTHNKNLIESLMDDKNKKNKIIFCRIFNLTFVECLEHFRGSKKFEVLEGINNLEDYLKEKNFDEDKEYCILFKYFVNNFEKIILEKKPRIKAQK